MVGSGRARGVNRGGGDDIVSPRLATEPATSTVQPGISARGNVAPFLAMELLRKANAMAARGDDVVRMEIGQPSTPAPRRARERVAAALAGDALGYTDAAGLPQLRERIGELYARRHGLTVAPERIIVTTGSSAGFVLCFTALFDAGARVALPSPGYPSYRQILAAFGVEPVLVRTGAATRWMPTPGLMDVAAGGGRLQALLLASPANPTGTMLSRQELAALIGWCCSHGAHFISDEIYHGLTFDAPAETALRFSDDVIAVNSFSKYYSMTGWRIGWLVVPEAMVERFERLQQHLYISAPTLSQHAALGALEAGAEEELESHRAVYARNRRILLDGLAAMGLGPPRIAPADGAFYVYVDISDLTDDAGAFAARLLAEAKVAATPGNDFDHTAGHKAIRFSYAGAPERIEQGVERIARFLRTFNG